LESTSNWCGPTGRESRMSALTLRGFQGREVAIRRRCCANIQVETLVPPEAGATRKGFCIINKSARTGRSPRFHTNLSTISIPIGHRTAHAPDGWHREGPESSCSTFPDAVEGVRVMRQKRNGHKPALVPRPAPRPVHRCSAEPPTSLAAIRCTW